MSEELKKGIPKAIVTGKVEFSEEEKERHAKELEKMMKNFGILKAD
jgi:hypothetical protein